MDVPTYRGQYKGIGVISDTVLETSRQNELGQVGAKLWRTLGKIGHPCTRRIVSGFHSTSMLSAGCAGN